MIVSNMISNDDCIIDIYINNTCMHDFLCLQTDLTTVQFNDKI